MNKITKEGSTPIYVSDARKIKDYLPNEELLSLRSYGTTRIMEYTSGVYKIEKSNKVKGVYVGDVCSICGMGEVVDAGGCATCNICNAQLKCGL